ncbi:tetratricopeptide repeat-containing sensor histidine kinase [Flavobacterium album]|uniref:tetratricopeptide repeat-containing sensor histidine kinase n=1 Tax=Flavobacterium album TaxID=2175091 RepID=UPI0011B20E80|nr:tetratricopeptide repeat protein [Flavobacterium album]
MSFACIKKWSLILSCVFCCAGSILYAQDFKETDSLQRAVDSFSRMGLNRKAAFEQNYVDARLMNAKPEIRVNSYYKVAQAYVRSREYDDAFYNIMMALESWQKMENPIGIAKCYSVMAQVYLYKKDYKKAASYHRKALSLFRDNPHKKGEAATAKVIYADFFIDRGNYTEALKQLTDALDETRGNGFYNAPAYIKDKAGFCHTSLGRPRVAEKYYLEALEDLKKNPYVDTEMSIQRHLGELCLSLKDYGQAQSWLEKCISLRPADEDNEEYMLANKSMAKLYLAQGNYEQAYNYELEAVIADRELRDAVTLTSTDAVATKYDAEQLMLQNKLLETEAETKKIAAEQADSRKNAFLFFFIFAIIVLATVLLFLYFYFRQKRAITVNRNNELKQKLLLTQMNPHFIFNSVDTIQSLIYEDKNDEAVDYLSKFSELTLQILENSSLMYISLKEEINMTANYLVIQQLLYNHNFDFEITADDGIDTETTYIPPMLTQPFIENAVKHGLAEKKEGGMIYVRFYKKQRKLYFEVSDNGKGLTGETRKGHRSMATKITSERLNAVPGDIEVANIIENGVARGAVSRFAIPYKIKNKPA